LMIDRAIPLGLALVECVLAGLEAEDAHLVVVRIGDLDDLYYGSNCGFPPTASWRLTGRTQS
jgi:hypothetical protein